MESRAAAQTLSAAVSRYPGWSTTNWNTFPTLEEGSAAPRPAAAPADIGPITGDPANGERLVGDRSIGGGCVACHVLPGFPMPGNVGPPLVNYGHWGRTDEWAFRYIYDPRVINPVSVMPPWGTNEVLTIQEIKDIVVYLQGLGADQRMPEGLDNPFARPVPEENRDHLDPTVNPAVFAIDDGRELFSTKGPLHASCQGCHANPEKSLRGAATRFPRWDAVAAKVLGVEEFVTRHAKERTGHAWPMQSDQNLAMSIYVRSLSIGMPLNVETTSPEARAAIERGRAMVSKKVGQLDFACLDCHGLALNRWIRGQYMTGLGGQVLHFPTWRTSRTEIWDLRKRFQWCSVAVRGNNLPADAPEYGDLELYLASISQGRPMAAPGIRH